MKRQLFAKKGVPIAASIVLAAIGLLGALSIDRPAPVIAKIANTSSTKQANAVNDKLVTANTRFGFKLFQDIYRQNSNRNIFISPTSVAIALAMTYNGSSGTTQQAMAQTLQLQGISLDEINQAQLALSKTLENPDPKVQLSIANSLWLKQGIPFQRNFLQRTEQYYKAKITNLDFSNPNSPSIINNWVNQNTNGKIPKIIDEINPASVLFLINAIYFKGTWQREFSRNATQQLPFTLLNGTRKQHPLMSQSGRYRYYEDRSFQAIALPYGSGQTSMYVFLPKPNVSFQSFYGNLNSQNWEEWMKQFTAREGSIVLPRFKLEYEITLNRALQSLGMGIAFQDRANFSGMTSTPVKIDEVKHKTFVEVNEEGTEAAAVTSVGVRVTSAQIPQQPPFRMVVDRPFFCAIRDDRTGTVLFVGSIVNP